MSQYRTERFRGLDWSLGLLGVSGQGEGACYPLTSSRPLQWYRCWIKVASRAEHPVLRDWPFEESSLSSATTSGMLVGLSPGPSLSSSSSSLRKLKLSRACSTVMLRLEARLRVRPCLCWDCKEGQSHGRWSACPCAASAQPSAAWPPYHEQTLQPSHLLLQALQLRELTTVVFQGSH